VHVPEIRTEETVTNYVIYELAFNDFDGAPRPGSVTSPHLADAWVREILRVWRTHDTEARAVIDAIGLDEATRQYVAAWSKLHGDLAREAAPAAPDLVPAPAAPDLVPARMAARTLARDAAIAEDVRPMTPEQIREKLQRRRRLGIKSVALELADRMRLLIAFRDTGDEEGFEHELGEIRRAVTEDGGSESAAARLDAALRRLGTHLRVESAATSPEFQAHVWKRLEASAANHTRWARRALLAGVFLGAIATVYLLWCAL
jgi:hypothetical protein